MESISLEGEARELLVGDLLALGVAPRVDLASHPKPGARSGRGDRIDDHRKTRQGPPPPVLADERKQPVLDLVPLARPRWKMANGDG